MGQNEKPQGDHRWMGQFFLSIFWVPRIFDSCGRAGSWFWPDDLNQKIVQRNLQTTEQPLFSSCFPVLAGLLGYIRLQVKTPDEHLPAFAAFTFYFPHSSSLMFPTHIVNPPLQLTSCRVLHSCSFLVCVCLRMAWLIGRTMCCQENLVAEFAKDRSCGFWQMHKLGVSEQHFQTYERVYSLPLQDQYGARSLQAKLDEASQTCFGVAALDPKNRFFWR